jgi:hypothetical protein
VAANAITVASSATPDATANGQRDVLIAISPGRGAAVGAALAVRHVDAVATIPGTPIAAGQHTDDAGFGRRSA